METPPFQQHSSRNKKRPEVGNSGYTLGPSTKKPDAALRYVRTHLLPPPPPTPALARSEQISTQPGPYRLNMQDWQFYFSV